MYRVIHEIRAQRLLDQKLDFMDNPAFADPNNDKAPFARDKADFWLPVDDYIGGAEHAVWRSG